MNAGAEQLVVFGDVLLDRDVDGTVSRVCPDAPAPVLDCVSERERAGGAGLAAVVAAAAGWSVTLVCAVADDEAGRRVRELLERAGVTVVTLAHLGTTPEKLRARAGGQVLLRLDRGAPGPVRVSDEQAERIEALVGEADAIVVADYGHGVAAHPRVRSILVGAGSSTPLVWDPHPNGADPVPGAWLVTPNEREAALLVGSLPRASPSPAHEHDEPRLKTAVGLASAQGEQLRAQWQARAVAVTRGEHGVVLMTGEGPPLVVPCERPVIGDTSGAGDVFAVAVAGALGSGAVHSEAVAAGVEAASRYVAAGNTKTWRTADNADGAAGAHAARLPAGTSTVAGTIAEVRQRHGTVVMTGGCFDLLHAGHVQLLRHARSLGDCLIVCLNSDRSVRALKGAGRPIVAAADRAGVLHALDCVDGVLFFDEDTPVALLDRYRPDIFVKGGDYSGAELPETAALRRWGGQVVTVPYVAGHSTSRILEEVKRDVSS